VPPVRCSSPSTRSRNPPEPVHLEHRPLRDDPDRRVEVGYQPDPHEGGDVVAELRTGTDGRYRVSGPYPGPGSSDAEVLTTPTTARAHSRRDQVTTKLR